MEKRINAVTALAEGLYIAVDMTITGNGRSEGAYNVR